MKRIERFQKKIDELQIEGIEVVELKHAYRVNGVIDIWKDPRMVFEIPANKYTRFETSQEMVDFAVDALKLHGKRPTFKKLPTGRISMKEFRHNKAVLDYENRKAGIVALSQPESPAIAPKQPKKAKQPKGGNTKITFGKYKGQKLKDIPDEYLRWVLENVTPLTFAAYIKERLKI